MTTTDITQPARLRRVETKAETPADDGGWHPAVVGISVVVIGCLVAVLYAALTGMSEWSEVIVLAGIALVTVAMMIAIDPLRRDR
jgi:protein-S-isoprenylcysteine O-methyltransferase Ste14